MLTQATDPANGPPALHDEPARSWHTQSAEVVAKKFKVDPRIGLSDHEAAQRRKQFGLNALTATKGRSAFTILVDQFKSLLVALLVLATIVAFVLGEPIEAVAILVVIVLNAAIGFLTEWRADRSLTALQRQTVPTAHVRRAGKQREIDASELVQPRHWKRIDLTKR